MRAASMVRYLKKVERALLEAEQEIRKLSPAASNALLKVNLAQADVDRFLVAGSDLCRTRC
jgi:hypothetical protein